MTSDANGKPTRTGRNRLPEGAARSAVVVFRLTEAERAAVLARAEAAGMPLTRYARALLLDDRRAAQPSAKAQRAEFVAQLIRMGNNLNQIARALNSGSAPSRQEAKLDSLLERIDTLLKDNGA